MKLQKNSNKRGGGKFAKLYPPPPTFFITKNLYKIFNLQIFRIIFVLFFIIYLCTIGAIISLISTFSGQALVGCELSPVDYRDNSKNSKVLNIRTHQITNINIKYKYSNY